MTFPPPPFVVGLGLTTLALRSLEEPVPLKSFACSICGAKAPLRYLREGSFQKRMSWLRRHRKRMHPKAFARSVRKGLRTRKER